MLAFSGHKFHALSGVGVLLVSAGVKLVPMVFGGGQQFGLRSGTENLWGIASLYYIFSILQKRQAEIACTLLGYRESFERTIKHRIPSAVIHCEQQPRIHNVSAIAFPPLEGEVLQIALDVEGVACGYGSACSSGATTAFKSLAAMGVDHALAASTLRFSFSYLLRAEDVEFAAEKVINVVTRLHSIW